MRLTVMDRILLLNLLPAEGSVTTLRIVRQLREDLSFSEEEHAALELVQADGKVTWNPAKAVEKDVAIGLKATNLIVEALTELSKAKKLQPSHLGLYDKFVGTEGE